jgi:CDP-diacylglycerol--glycerol-3-phosphate 3-phosphatidyltransferase
MVAGVERTGADDWTSDWSRRHDGYDLGRSVLARGWVSGMHRLAEPLARCGVAPDAVTFAGLGSALAATRTPPRVAATLVVLAALLDGLDGAVAVQRRTTSRHGAALDHLADRVGDVAFGTALARAGAGRSGRVAAVTVVAYELARDAVRLSGRSPRGTVMVGERPVRVVVTAVGLVTRPRAAALVLGGLAIGSTAQLAVSVRSAQR